MSAFDTGAWRSNHRGMEGSTAAGLRARFVRIVASALLLAAPSLPAADHVVDADRTVDFTAMHTFSMRATTVLLKRPEVDSPLVHRELTAAIRALLVAKGLREVEQGADLVVDWTLLGQRMAINEWGHAVPLEVMRGGRQVPADHPWRNLPEAFVEGTLVLDLVQQSSGLLVWRGVYRNNERDSARFGHNVAAYPKALLAEFPPRRR
jgi:hypothetical protein